MEYELIEALLAERSLGHLSQETSELLEEYISGNMEYLELARGFEQLAVVGKQLAVFGDDIRLPDFPRERIEQTLSPGGGSTSFLRWLSTAAIFLIGLGVIFYTANNQEIEPVLADGPVEQFVVVEPLVDSGMIEGFIDKDRMLKRYERLRNDIGGFDRSDILKMKGLL